MPRFAAPPLSPAWPGPPTQRGRARMIMMMSLTMKGFTLPGPNYDRLFQQACAQATMCDQSRSAQSSSRRAHRRIPISSTLLLIPATRKMILTLPVISTSLNLNSVPSKLQYRKSQKKKGSDSRRVSLTKETWSKLSDPAKAAWDILSRGEKDMVLADAANIKSGKGRAAKVEAAEHSDLNPERDPDPGPAPDHEDRHVNNSDTSKPTKPSPGSLQSILECKGSRGTHQSKQTTFQLRVTYVSSSGG
jgi:hypothetical protein